MSVKEALNSEKLPLGQQVLPAKSTAQQGRRERSEQGMAAAEPKRSASPSHIEPLPARAVAKQQKRSAKSWGVLFLMTTLFLGFAATWLFPPSAEDRVSAAEVEQRASAFASVAPLELKPVPPQQQEARLAEMQLAPTAQVELKQLLQRSSAPSGSHSAGSVAAQPTDVRLVELTVWDSHAPDGDVVRVISAGYSRDVTLHKQPLVLAIPVQGSMPIQIVGVHDGGGGITLAVQGAHAPIMTPIMSEGQTVAVRVAP